MKRFYATVAVTAEEGGWRVRLDDRLLGTPERRPLFLPTGALAEAIASEWEAQGDRIEPATMPMTGFANAAADRIAPERARHVDEIARYGETDLVCYRAEAPRPLVAAEAAAWDPLMEWAAARYDVALRPVAGVMHQPQPPVTLARLRAAVDALDVPTLAGLARFVPVGGSLLAGLRLADAGPAAELLVDALLPALFVDELWQAEQWGEDAEARQNREDRVADLRAAARFIALAARTASRSGGNTEA